MNTSLHAFGAARRPMKSLLRYPALRGMKFNRSMMVMAVVILVSKSFKSIYDRLFPIGYEDEEGFHYGGRKRQM
jgi:hypothetical protein